MCGRFVLPNKCYAIALLAFSLQILNQCWSRHSLEAMNVFVASKSWFSASIKTPTVIAAWKCVWADCRASSEELLMSVYFVRCVTEGTVWYKMCKLSSKWHIAFIFLKHTGISLSIWHAEHFYFIENNNTLYANCYKSSNGCCKLPLLWMVLTTITAPLRHESCAKECWTINRQATLI